MDSITHAFLAAALLIAIGVPELIPFGVLGAVILDADVLFHIASSKRPSLYMFIHGGAAHSIAGAFGMALLGYGLMCFLLLTGEFFFRFTSPFSFNLFAFAAVAAGAMLHVLLDFLASPGIPLFWPWKDTKYTAGIFAGPSAVMIFISWTFILLYITGFVQISGLLYYGILFLVYLTASIAIRIVAAAKINGKTLPTINPLRWMAIENGQDCWQFKFVNLLSGYESENRTWPALQGVTRAEVDGISDIPEVRRVRYHSIFTIARRLDNRDIIIEDPSRVEGIIRYPPYFASVTLAQSEGAGWKVVTE